MHITSHCEKKKHLFPININKKALVLFSSEKTIGNHKNRKQYPDLEDSSGESP
jgi:hypothetical protein